MDEKPLTCGTCTHWKKQVNPADLSDIKGACTESPPTASAIVGPRGQIGYVAAYPMLQAKLYGVQQA